MVAELRAEDVGTCDQQHLRLLEACVARLRDCVIIAEIDAKGRPSIVYVNDAFVERTGYARDEVIGRTTAILHGPGTQPEVIARIERAFVTGQAHRDEILSYTKHGEPLWLELDVAPVADASGRITHWISVERDITSRKAVEEELRKSEEQHRLLFAQNPMPMWAYDLETLRFCAVNDAAIAHYGYTREQFLAMTIADIRPSEDVASLREAVHGEDVGLGKSGIWRHRTADGRILHVEISSHKMKLDGRASRVVLANDVTREVAAVEALRASEAGLARAQRIAHLGSWEVELATNALSWSDEIYRIFGIERDRFGATYEAFLACVHPDDRDKMHAAHIRARTGESKLDLEHRTVRRDGTVRWVRELGELEYDGAGVPVRLTGTVLDITERKREEQRQTVGRHVLEVITSGRPLAAILDEVVRAIETLEPTFSAKVLLPGAAAPPPSWCVFPVRARDGSAVAALAVEAGDGASCEPAQRDLFERMRDLIAIAFDRDAAQRELRESEERFRLLATGTNDAIWDYDVDTGSLWWSDGITRLFGVDRNDLEPALVSWTRRIHPDDEKRIVDGFHASLAAAVASWSDEYRFLRADGTYASVLDRGHIIRDATGRAVRVIGGITDVTEHKELERQLLRSQRLESIGTLAGGVAHDLNNVLQPILMEVEGLREAASAAGRLDDLLSIERSAQRGAALVRQLLSFARGTEVPRAPLELAQIAGELRKLLRDTFPKNIELAMYVAPNLRRVRANAIELHQVLLNLCVNARDAMPAGGSLRISFMNRDRHVVIEVEDSGTGMTPEVMDRMFDPFFTTKEVGRGTGLGLATVHAIVRSHDGFLTVDSEVGTGSMFRVFLPATDELPVATEPSAAPSDGTGQTILVVDDEAHIRAATQRILERHGYRVRTAATGRDAIEVFGRERICAVVLDLAMPDLDGAATLAALARLDPMVPVIGASGLASSEFVSAVRCFLSKPYSTRDLLGALAGVIAPA
jgi:PAS domain S-box-containing protein